MTSDSEGAGAAKPDGTIPAAAARRLSHQLERAYRGTFGAKTGLQAIVTAVARQLLQAGVPCEEIERRLIQVVVEHPARGVGDSPHMLTGEPYAQLLVQLTRDCVAHAARSSMPRGNA